MFNKIITSIFGSKKDKDIKELGPYAEKVNVEYDLLRQISDDDLRDKSDYFRNLIDEHLKDIDKEIELELAKIKGEEDILAKDALYRSIDELKKTRNEELENILLEILPQAFAVVKETSRRLSENKQLVVKATDWDRELAAKKGNVVIKDDHAIWKNVWMVAGNEMEWNMVHYDVQLMGGVTLHSGKIAEMATGEGKTLVATLPCYLNALTRQGVHVVTVNNYLAKRDSEWNAPLFEFHGISVDCIDRTEPNSDERKAAYKADITFGTNNEFGFDYLRDNMTTNSENLVQRNHHYAIIDEIDSVLIDEARTPLIISGPVPKGDVHEFHNLKPRIEKILQAQRKLVTQYIAHAKKEIANPKRDLAEAAGTDLFRAFRGLPKNNALIKFLSEPGMKTALLKREGFFMGEKGKHMHIADEPLYFVIDEKNNQIELTEKGRDLITGEGEDPDFFVLPDVGAKLVEIDLDSKMSEEDKLQAKENLSRDFASKSERLHTINQLLKAYTLFEKEIDYIVQESKVQIVDEQTGRVLPGRRYSDGLHQAIEAKENVKVEAATQTFASVTLQNFFRMYHKLSGMTGTAETEAQEFYEIYKLDVVVVPTNRPIARDDRDDLVYKTKLEKYNAVIDEVDRLTQEGRPVLVGTTSVEVSEKLSRMMKARGFAHNVLNAKHHEREAEIVAEAGIPGKVTIATNMAGRGTDIKLSEEVINSGGLAIVGTERHESRRIDRQLRGRAGRQGDPGSSQFFVSLEDELMRLFGSERIAKIMDRMGLREGEVIQHSMITKSISNAQKKVEENNFGMRKRLLEYDDVMNSQREVVYKRRRNSLSGQRIKVDLDHMLQDLVQGVVSQHYSAVDAEGLKLDCVRLLAIDPEVSEQDFNDMNQEKVIEKVYTKARDYYDHKSKKIAEGALPILQGIAQNNPEVELVRVPFSDGQRMLSVLIKLQESIQSEGKEITQTLEKSIMLAVIDENWKEHLREMDHLRTSVQNATYEQKDPLLVYKFESFQLFQKVLYETSEEVISMLFKSRIVVGEDEKAKNAEVKRDDFSNMRASHESVEDTRNQDRRRIPNVGDDGNNRPMSRRERRMTDRSGKKKK